MLKKLALGISLVLSIAATLEGQQWVRIEVRPVNAILTVDTARIVLRNGHTEMMIGVGKHSYTAESPFYEVKRDSFEVTDAARCDLLIVLQASYGYIKIGSKQSKADKYYIDQCEIASRESNRVNAGDHRLTVLRDSTCLFDGRVTVVKGEKSIVNLDSAQVQPFRWDAARWRIPLTALSADGSSTVDSTVLTEVHATADIQKCGVSITSNVEDATIFVDGEVRGTTPLVVTGLVAKRRYIISLRKNGYRDANTTFAGEEGKIGDATIKMRKKQ